MFSFVTLLTWLDKKFEYEYTRSKIPSKWNTDYHYSDFKTITVLNNIISYSGMVENNFIM